MSPFQIAHVQDRLGMESEETISALVGDASAEEGRPVDSKQLLQEIASLKEQVRTHKSTLCSRHSTRCMIWWGL